MTAKVEIVNDGGVVEVDIDGQVSENVSIGAFDVEVLETNVGGLSTIFGASDTNFNSLADKDALFYNIASNKWLNSIAYFEYVKTQNFVGLPVHMETLQQWIDHIYSSGRVHGLELTDNLDGTVDIASGVAIMRAVDDPHTTLYSVNIDGVSNLAFTNNQTNFVYAEYDAVSPSVNVTLNPNDINLTTRVPLFVVVREDAHLTIYDVGEDSVDSNASLRKRFFYTEKFVRADGGSIIYDAGTFHIGCTAGEFYFGLTSFTFDAFDTTGADTFEYYRLINGAWVETGESTISNTQYNDISVGGSESLVALGSNKFAVHWVYLLGSTINPHFSVVYSQGEYTNLANAEAATVPSNVPASIEGLGILLGRVIVRDGDSEITAIESVFTTTFSPALATDHNNLAGLQGGTTNEYYHLTSEEYFDFQDGFLKLDGSTVMTGVIDTDVGTLQSNVAATGDAFSFDTSIDRTTGSVLSFKDGGVEFCSINHGIIQDFGIDNSVVFNTGLTGGASGLADGYRFGQIGGAGEFQIVGDLGFFNILPGQSTVQTDSEEVLFNANAKFTNTQWLGALGNACDLGSVTQGFKDFYLKGSWISSNLVGGYFSSAMSDISGRSAFTVDTVNAIAASDTWLMSLQNNSVEKFAVDKNGGIYIGGNIDVGSASGVKIGTTTAQKIGFWNAAPVIQPSGTGETTGFTAGTGTGVNDDSTFTGNIGSTAYRVNDIVKALKQCGLIAS